MVTSRPIEKQKTLHLLAAAPSYWPILIPQILTVWHEGDMIILLAQGAQGFSARILHSFNQMAILEADLARLGIVAAEIPAHITVATTAHWARWTMQYQRTVTWR